MQNSTDSDFKKLLAEVEKKKASGTYDLSLEEDLSLAVMNLISLEEHFFFTSQKTGKPDYLDLLSQTREMRKRLLARLIPQTEGETWCISKHLLAGSMRLMEVATKLQSDGKNSDAQQMFSDAYKVYSLFWAIRFKLIDVTKVKVKPENTTSAWSYEDIVTKLVDCCKE